MSSYSKESVLLLFLHISSSGTATQKEAQICCIQLKKVQKTVILLIPRASAKLKYPHFMGRVYVQ